MTEKDSNVTNNLFDDYFSNINLDNELVDLCDKFGDTDLKNINTQAVNATNVKNQNYKRYQNLKISKLDKLPPELGYMVDDIKRMYNMLSSNQILEEKEDEIYNTAKLLDEIDINMDRLDLAVRDILNKMKLDNISNLSKINIDYISSLNIDFSLKRKLMDKYNDILLFDSYVGTDDYEALAYQVQKRNNIRELINLLSVEEKYTIEDRLSVLNKEIENFRKKYEDKIQYLSDLLIPKSIYVEEFDNFKKFYREKLSYDDTSYSAAKKVYEFLYYRSKFFDQVKSLEDLFIEEYHKQQTEQTFVYERYGPINLNLVVNFIKKNYYEYLDDENQNILDYVINKINNPNYDLKDIEMSLGLVVEYIWSNTITPVDKYDSNNKFAFLCTNKIFTDEKVQAILLTKDELAKVNDYSDYQIGFICKYNKNILYITENDDINSVDYNDLSYLKTPLQIESDFINFRICNRIALNGNEIQIEAVYFIDDKDQNKYNEAKKLSETYNLPLLVIGK